MKENTSRRQFLKTSVAIPAALAVGSTASLANAAPARSDTSKPLPTRKLGKNGPDVSILNIGGMMSAHSPQYLELAWQHGIRYFDTAKVYIKGKSEKNVAGWIQRYPERRKDLFLVSKEPANSGPEALLDSIDERLEACGTDYLDLLFLHGIGPRGHGQESFDWPKSSRFQKVIDKIKSDGKAKMVGFSCHDGQLVEYLNAAAEGGFVDAIMLKYNPFFTKGDAFDRALDACYDKGIGLISMKEMRPFAKAPKANPDMEALGLTTHQGILHAVWSDPRISSICSAMENIGQLKENSEAALKFENAMDPSHMEALQKVAAITPAAMCPGCPACDAKAKETEVAFHDISRYLCYYEQEGSNEGRELYQKLPSVAKDTRNLDLHALKEQCAFNVDYPQILERADRYFG